MNQNQAFIYFQTKQKIKLIQIIYNESKISYVE